MFLPPPSTHFRPLRAVAAALLLLTCVALGACSRGSGTAKAEEASVASAIPVEVATVTRQTVTATYSGTATLEARDEADVVARTGGILRELRVEEGQSVRKGELLARIDDASARNSLAQAEATLRKYQAKFDRAERAVKTHLIPKDEYDQDKFDLETQRAVTAGAELDLSYTRVVAPMDGVISRRLVKAGNPVQVETPLFHIVDMEPLLAVLNVPERDLGTVAPGQNVQLHVDALPGREFPGTVARIAPVVDAASGTFRVTCEFNDTTHALRPGLFGRIDIHYDRHADALTVPRAALIDEDGETSVFVLAKAKPAAGSRQPEHGKGTPAHGAATSTTHGQRPQVMLASRRVLETGYADGDRVEVRSGLDAGDRVITVGRNAVRDGAEVEVLEDRP
jgi:membrane fusion protein (multidrug efflux system)